MRKVLERKKSDRYNLYALMVFLETLVKVYATKT